MLRDLIYNYWDSDLPEVFDREIDIDISTDVVSDIVGVRRAGKTYLMFDVIKKLLKKSDKKSTIYINFENRRLLPLSADYFNQIISFIYQEELFEKYKKVYLFLDEVQRIKGWEKYIRSIYDEFKGKIKIFVSGSSANLLSEEYGKLLTGRHLTVAVFPLSFGEFLGFKDVQVSGRSERGKAQIKKYLEEYLEFGGFPEVVLQKVKGKKEDLLNQLFGDILSRDVLGRAEARKEHLIEEFSYFLASNISQLLSFNKMVNYFSSRGIKVSVPTLENYFYLTKNAFLFFDNTIFSYKIRDQLQYPRKIYCIDDGLANLIGFKFSKNLGWFYENTVAIELARRFFNKPTVKIFYWKNRRGQEVDFVVRDRIQITRLIQVCADIKNKQTKEREVNTLIEASKELRCSNLLVITSDFEGEEKVNNKKISFVPLWKWLLANNK